MTAMAAGIAAPTSSHIRLHYRLVAHVAGPALLSVNGGFHIMGSENVPGSGPALLCPNHVSYADPPIVAMGVRRRVCFMAKKELFALPLLGPFIARSYAYPVDREEGGRQAIRVAVELLRAGELLVIFPEGTRSPDGELIAGKSGPAFIASRANAPIVPVAMWGTDVVLPLHTKRLYRCPVYLSYGEPLPPPVAAEGGRVSREELDAFTGRLMSRIGELQQQIRAEVPDRWLRRADALKADWRARHLGTEGTHDQETQGEA